MSCADLAGVMGQLRGRPGLAERAYECGLRPHISAPLRVRKRPKTTLPVRRFGFLPLVPQPLPWRSSALWLPGFPENASASEDHMFLDRFAEDLLHFRADHDQALGSCFSVFCGYSFLELLFLGDYLSLPFLKICDPFTCGSSLCHFRCPPFLYKYRIKRVLY